MNSNNIQPNPAQFMQDSSESQPSRQSHVTCTMPDGREITIEGLTDEQAVNVYQALCLVAEEGRPALIVHGHPDNFVSFISYPIHDHGDEPEMILNPEPPQAGSFEAVQLVRRLKALTDDELVGRRQELDFYLERCGKLNHYRHTYYLIGAELTSRGIAL